MTFEEIVTLARSIAGDKDPAALRYSLEELGQLLAEVKRDLGVRQVAGITVLTVTLTEGAQAVTPEPTDMQGIILATAVAHRLLQQTYRARVDSGTIGISWRSGLEEESTINQEKAYRTMVAEVQKSLDELIVLTNVPLAGTRPQ